MHCPMSLVSNRVEGFRGSNTARIRKQKHRQTADICLTLTGREARGVDFSTEESDESQGTPSHASLPKPEQLACDLTLSPWRGLFYHFKSRTFRAKSGYMHEKDILLC